MNHSPAAAAFSAFGSVSQYSDGQLRKASSSSSRYYDLECASSELTASPRRLASEYRGWNRESDLHSVPFGMRGKESVRPYASPLVGSTSRTARMDEPLVPRPTFTRPTSATSAGGGGSSLVYSSSSAASSAPISKNYPLPAPASTASAAASAHFSISAHELYCGDSSKVFPNGSPYHCLRAGDSVAGSAHVSTRGANYYDNDRRRPKSVISADSSEADYPGYLDWSEEIDKILANICTDKQSLENDEEEDDLSGNYANNPPPPPAPPLPANFQSQVAAAEDEDDDENYKSPPEVPPRQRRNRKSVDSSSVQTPRASSVLNISSTTPQTSLVNGLPPTPKVHMGACFSKVFNECPLKVHCAASWVHPDTHDQHILLGCDEGIYCLNLNELHDATLDQLYPRKTTWMYVIKNVLMSISGKASYLYRHDIAQLYSKKNLTFGLPSTVDSMINRIPEKLMPRKFMTASTRVPDTKGTIRCCVGRNSYNGYKYLCGIAPNSIFLMQFYNPLNKFMLLKSFDHYIPPNKPLKLLEMIIAPGMDYPMLCTDVRTSSDPSQVELSLINLNVHSGAVWFDKDGTLESSSNSMIQSHHLQYDELDMEAFGDGTETVVPVARFNKNGLNPVSVKHLEDDSIMVAYDNRIIMVDLNGRLKSSRTQPSELLFDFKINSTVCLPDSVLAFHNHGMQGRSFSNNEIVQEITDPSRSFKVIGADQTIVLESRPSKESYNTDSPSNLYILTGHENSY